MLNNNTSMGLILSAMRPRGTKDLLEFHPPTRTRLFDLDPPQVAFEYCLLSYWEQERRLVCDFTIIWNPATGQIRYWNGNPRKGKQVDFQGYRRTMHLLRHQYTGPYVPAMFTEGTDRLLGVLDRHGVFDAT